MKFNQARKDAINQYILSKIDEGKEGISHLTAEAFGISTSTVHSFLNELIEKGTIVKQKRDSYVLATKRNCFLLLRSKGEIEYESDIYNRYLLPTVRDLPDNVQRIWNYSFSEMVNNVIDHSESEKLWIIIDRSEIKTNVAVLDDGVGIFRKIQEYFGYPSLEDAIIELSKGKLTTDKTRHSGEGVFFTSRIMDEFLIYSDKKAFTFNKYREEALDSIEKEYQFSTCVSMSLSNRSKKQLIDVFNEYADTDNGFIKTRIPLKNIFESALISRSQAKRLASRLEQFREIELDFDGIDFMGQGFAHELFYVFANAHPEIKLNPFNMSADVEKMLSHVTEKQSEK